MRRTWVEGRMWLEGPMWEMCGYKHHKREIGPRDMAGHLLVTYKAGVPIGPPGVATFFAGHRERAIWRRQVPQVPKGNRKLFLSTA